MSRCSRAAVAAALLALLAALLPASPALAGAERGGATPNIWLYNTGERAFSPNGDGAKDRLRFRYMLEKGAVVRVRVFRLLGAGEQKLVRGPVRLGAQDPGEHLWWWDGRNDKGRVVPVGYYRVQFRSWQPRPRVRSTARGFARVDTHVDPVVLYHRDTVVYPRSTEVEDYLALEFDPPYDAASDGAVARVRNAQGRIVRRVGVPDGFDRWYATTYGGAPLPPGDYTYELTVRDVAGNTTTTRLPVEVSALRLTERVAEPVVVAADTYTSPCAEPGSPNGCGDYPPCGTTSPSARFAPGGITLHGPDETEECPVGSPRHASAYYRPEVGWAHSFGHATVTVFGGPTVPGSGDVATLHFGGEASTGPDTSDHETTSAPVSLASWSDHTGYHWLQPEQPPQDRVRWTLEAGEGNSFDAAWFRVDYTYYAPE